MTNGDIDIHKWWPMIVAFSVVAVSWGTMQTQVSAIADDVDAIKKENVQDDQTDVTERLKVRSLEERQQSIQDDVEDIREEQKEQSKKLDAILEKLNERE